MGTAVYIQSGGGSSVGRPRADAVDLQGSDFIVGRMQEKEMLVITSSGMVMAQLLWLLRRPDRQAFLTVSQSISFLFHIDRL